ncbi:response regulator [Aquabacterium lacunae]|uniref:Sensory/regulatory protein RpfC n=1 Tax=Aquabacterium lacunae TaxID=2528630 RepID=A0A4Q9GVC4_9BURK|nr:response regulator [Aquabacterium lacunae]TBO28370.1 response regulator [Aquabacterium lacunae]
MNLRRRLWLAATLWTVVVVVGTGVAYRVDQQHARHQALEVGGHRLDSLRDSLNVTFQQLSALPRALGREESIRHFLKEVPVPDSASITEADRPRMRDLLMARADVLAMSRQLKATCKDFNLTEVLMLDSFGTGVADSNFELPINPIGGNYKTRSYFTDALDHGVGVQFAVGRVSHIPGFYFAGRIDDNGKTVGVLVIKQEPTAMARLFDDEKRPIFVTDASGVVIMGNRPEWILKHAPMRGQMALSEAAQVKTYHAKVDSLPWHLDLLKVKERDVTVVTVDRVAYMAQPTALLNDTHLAWVLTPLGSESGLLMRWASIGGLALVLGYWTLAMMAQRQRRMHTLQQARQDLHDMAHALPLSVFRYQVSAEGQGRFSFLSQTAAKLLGEPLQAIEADPARIWGLCGGADGKPPIEPTERALEAGGKPRWVRTLSQPTLHPDGSTTYNGCWLDITEQKEQITRSMAVFSSAPNAYLFFDRDLGVLRANPAAIRMFNAGSEKALQGLKPWLPPMSAPTQSQDRSAQELAEHLLDEVTRTGQPITFEWLHSTIDGKQFAAEAVLIPFMNDGVQQYCVVIQDISTRKQTEAFMQAAQQAAEAATQAKSRFLANMSHEIRTPMNAILGMTHLALMDDMPARARNYVDKAHRAAGSLLQILNDILDVSKIESGKLTLEATEFQLESVVSQMAEVLGVRAEEKRLELLFTAEPDIPTALVGDPVRLGQVLINLGTNAIKFTAKGEVIIGCEVHSQSTEHATLHFWVRDTGIGMNADQLSRLFEPFTQGDTSTTRQYGGTGLGLAICKQLVQLMGGNIWAESREGHGTTLHFTATFGVQHNGQTRRALLAQELRHKRLLLVDDNPSAREVLGDMARRLGLDVEVADSGTQALRRMEQAAFDGRPHHLLLTDWQMPGMDGIEFARRALALPPEQRPCVLLVTAYARDEALKAAEGVPLAGVLNKPVTPSTLLDTIGRALGQDTPALGVVRQSAQVLESAQRHLAGARVLLVEDQPMNMELACDLLQRAGLQVVTAQHGKEALEILARDRDFDGVLMDCQMPVLDGYDTARRMRADDRLKHLPIVAMTASAMASDRERVLDAGMNDHITKPLDLPQMFTIMARWITPRSPALPQATSPVPTPTLSNATTLNTVDGLNRCMGNLDLYRRLLKGFAKTQAGMQAQLQEALEKGDWATLHGHAHALKGLAGNIGAEALADAAEALETEARLPQIDGTLDAIGQRVRQLIEQLRLTLADVQLLMQVQGTTAPQEPPPDANTLRPRLAELRRLMAQHEAQARHVMDELRQDMPGVVHWPAAADVAHALQHYDFDEALQALARWEAEIEG